MSIRVIRDVAVICDYCETIGPAGRTAVEAREEARRDEGWETKRGGPDVCGDCIDKAMGR